MRRASYRDAIRWIATEDDTSFLQSAEPRLFLSVTACLVRDVFDVDEDRLIADISRAVAATWSKT